LHENWSCDFLDVPFGKTETIASSKHDTLPPEVTSRSRDANKPGGGVNYFLALPHPHTLINMQMR